MPRYRIKPGKKHYMRVADRSTKGLRKYVGGDTIELTERQARYIKSKLELIGPTSVEVEFAAVRAGKAKEAAPRVIAREDGKYDVFHAETSESMSDEPLGKRAAAGLAGVKMTELPVYEALPNNGQPMVVEVGDGDYNVIHPETGEAINDSPLTLDQANSFADNWKPEG